MRAEFDDFPTSSAFFGSFMINYGFETCIFISLIYTNWILFSIILSHCFTQFRSETAIMRAEFNDFPTSSGFFWPFMINFGSETFRSLIYTTWIKFSTLLGPFLLNSDVKLPLWEQNLMIFQLHLHFFESFMINFGSETCNFWILDTYRLDIDFNPFGSIFCSIQIWNCHFENRI